jgi:hypothetical protein
MGRTGHARAGFAALLLLGACRTPEDTLDTLRRTPLPAMAAAGATLAVDSASVAWVGAPGRLVGVDSGGAAVAEVRLGGDTVPRLLWREGDRLVMELPGRLATAPAAGGAAGAGWASAALRGALRDPRGRWVYALTEGGGVVGLDAATLQPRWGWPEAGAEPLAGAVSPLADRVYLALDTAGGREAALQVRDAATGRLLAAADEDPALAALATALDGGLFAAGGGAALRLAHTADEVRRVWREPTGVRGADGWMALRVDPAGRRLAVFGRGEGARLALLDARTGELLGETREAPRDAAFGPEGRLYLLEEGALRVVR